MEENGYDEQEQHMEDAEFCGKKSCLSAERVAELRARLNRLEGHVRAVNRMLEEGRDCQSLLLQIAAVKSALNKLTAKMLEGYIEGCLVGGYGKDGARLEQLKNALSLALKFS
ncbi:MAG: metal-sensitive transcriptional regulator [Chloroflexia bacterium]|nr:metal-sensitive transcriptional regulator [Chloroflexia bacterium]